MPRRLTFNDYCVRTDRALRSEGYVTEDAIRSAFLEGRLSQIKNLGSRGLREISAVLGLNKSVSVDSIYYLAASGRQVRVVSVGSTEHGLPDEAVWIVEYTRGADAGKTRLASTRELVISVNG